MGNEHTRSRSADSTLPRRIQSRSPLSNRHHPSSITSPRYTSFQNERHHHSKRTREPQELQYAVNDFLFENSSTSNDTVMSNGFDFGVYLEYWRLNRHNSVIPKYKSLEEELTSNLHAPLSEQQFKNLKSKCKKIQATSHGLFIAADVGTMNKVCGIPAGSAMTLDHMMCVTLYTDFTEHQNIFKKHCRRLYRDETIESVVERNTEIAHWSRTLKECIMFFGQTMTENDVVYSGMNAQLLFRSLNQRFEAPVSTTMTETVAQNFAMGPIGIILKLKRENAKTRYLNVEPFTAFRGEDERLFMGSALKIVDILMDAGTKSLRKYIAALSLLEQIVNGHFMLKSKKTRKILLALVHRVTAPLVMDSVRNVEIQNDCISFLDQEGYDTDAVVEDIKDPNDSNIRCEIGDDAAFSKLCKSVQATCADRARIANLDNIPQYVWSLFVSFLDETKKMKQRGTLWINPLEMNQDQNAELKEALFGSGMLFDCLGINKEEIPMVQQFNWKIEGDEYERLKILDTAECIISPQFQYDVNGQCVITFRLKCYGRFSEANPRCGIFLELVAMPKAVKKLRIEVHFKCIKEGEYTRLMRTQILTAKKRICGFQAFEHEEFDRNPCIEWVFGVKIFNSEINLGKTDGKNLQNVYHFFV